jgi:hypothetical protein
LITALIFFAHIIFALIIFTKKWQDENLTAAFMNLALIAVLFTVGWTIVTMITQLFISPKGFGILMDADAINLSILTIGEYFFYKFYYVEKPIEAGKEIL